MKVFLSLMVGLASVAAVAQFSQSPINNAFGPPVQWTTVAEGQNSALVKSEQEICVNQTQWQNLYSRMAGDTKVGNTPAPNLVDWTKHDLIVVHSGRKATVGYRVYVSTISRPRTGIKQVEIIEARPPRGAFLAQQMTSPYVVIRVDKAIGNYSFKRIGAINNFVPAANTCQCGCPHCCGGAKAGGTHNHGNVTRRGGGFTMNYVGAYAMHQTPIRGFGGGANGSPPFRAPELFPGRKLGG